MLERLRKLGRNVPVFFLAFALALAAWISAVTENDPTVQRIYNNPVRVEIVGQDPGLIITSEIASQIKLILKAPQSIWNRLDNEDIPVRAVLDLSGLEAGLHELEVQVQVGIAPVEIVSCDPCNFEVELENLDSREVAVSLEQKGELAVGFQADEPVWEPETVLVSGPESAVDSVFEVVGVLELNEADETINRSISLEALDSTSMPVSDVTITPNRVNVNMNITQRGGYRNVVVKVSPSGQVASGYRVTNISVFPPTVTVFSADPELVDDLPGYVETAALDLTGAKDDLDLRLLLDLPPGVTIVGEQTVMVQVGIAAIEGSITLSDMEVEVEGVAEGLIAEISPTAVDVIISGPLPLLENMTKSAVRVYIDLSGEVVGTYQRVPIVEFDIPDLSIESILPGSVEITLTVVPGP